MIATGTQAMAADAAPVRLSDLTRELGINIATRRNIIDQRLITPIQPVRRGRPTCISPEDAERVRKAALVATATAYSIVIVLKILRALPL